jgi:hypothetical protein
MTEEEDIFFLEQEKALIKVKPDIERALNCMESAMHWLHETEPYQSEVLDNICGDLKDHIYLIKRLLSDKKV